MPKLPSKFQIDPRFVGMSRKKNPLTEPKQQEQSKEPPKPPKPTGIEIIRDQDSGEPRGVRLPDGREILGMSEREIRDLVKGEQDKSPIPIDVTEAGGQRTARELQQKAPERLQAISEVAQAPTEEELQTLGKPQGVNPGQAAGQAVASNLAVGATSLAGAPATGGASAVLGAGFVATSLFSTVSTLKSQFNENIQAEVSNVGQGTRNLKAIVATTTPENADEQIALFQHQLNRIDEANSNLYLTTRTDTAKFLGKEGKPELEKFEIFNEPGGQRDLLIRAMQIKVTGGDPSALLAQIQDQQVNQ